MCWSSCYDMVPRSPIEPPWMWALITSIWGWQLGGVSPKDKVFTPILHGFILLHHHSALPCMTEKIFLPHPHPLGPREDSPHSVKLYLLIYPQLLQLFLIKPISLIKIYFKLQINLSHQIKLIFSKNWIILLKYLKRQYPNKNKNLIIQN